MPSLHIRALGTRLGNELGLYSVATAGLDVHLLILSRTVRMFAYGASALILAIYFSAVGIRDERIGLFMTLTLLGDVGISLLLTLVADRLGRRRTLFLGALSMAAAGAVFASTTNYYLLLIAAIIGVISPSGSEIGPFRAVEESTIAHLVPAQHRSDIFAWYVVMGSLGTTAGLAVAGAMVEYFKTLSEWTEIDAYRAIFWGYAVMGAIKAALTLLLSRRCEYGDDEDRCTSVSDSDSDPDETRPLLGVQGQAPAENVQCVLEGDQHPDNMPSAEELRRRLELLSKPESERQRRRRCGIPQVLAQISPESCRILFRLCLLFFVDSLASGMVPYSVVNLYMDRKFHMPKSNLGSIMSATWLLSTVGNIFASAISKRIGLIKTMVFTHLPSAIFLALLPAPRSLILTICLLAGRAALASMDQAPRSAFLSAVVLPEERTAVMGIVNVVKTLSQSGGPSVTGWLAGGNKFWVAFLVAGSLKAAYDIGLLTFFVNMRLHGRESRDGTYEREVESGSWRATYGGSDQRYPVHAGC